MMKLYVAACFLFFTVASAMPDGEYKDFMEAKIARFDAIGKACFKKVYEKIMPIKEEQDVTALRDRLAALIRPGSAELAKGLQENMYATCVMVETGMISFNYNRDFSDHMAQIVYDTEHDRKEIPNLVFLSKLVTEEVEKDKLAFFDRVRTDDDTELFDYYLSLASNLRQNLIKLTTDKPTDYVHYPKVPHYFTNKPGQ